MIINEAGVDAATPARRIFMQNGNHGIYDVAFTHIP